MTDNTTQLRQAVQTVLKQSDNKTAFRIVGGGSKQSFLPPPGSNEQPLSVAAHSGIICYTPTELVITARAGTPIATLNAALAEKQQMLAFEPPENNGSATVGGTIAMAAAGSGGGYYGMTKDFVLGIHSINGNGEVLRFGGEVMKNVAGYDVSRLMTGAMGTLGIILQASLKVLPLPKKTLTLQFQHTAADAYALLAKLVTKPYPLSASCYDSRQQLLSLRLSGGEAAVNNSRKHLGGDLADNTLWKTLNEMQHPLFNENVEKRLWQIRATHIPAAPDFPPAADHLAEWGGRRIWLAAPPDFDVAAWAKKIGAQALCSGAVIPGGLPAAQLKLLRNIKTAFDPHYLFNPSLSPRHI